MRRASFERPRTLRTWRRHLALIHSDGEILCVCEFQAGRFRKGQRASGCGKPRCMCHYPKLFGLPTRQLVRSNHSYCEFLEELGRPASHLGPMRTD